MYISYIEGWGSNPVRTSQCAASKYAQNFHFFHTTHENKEKVVIYNRDSMHYQLDYLSAEVYRRSVIRVNFTDTLKYYLSLSVVFKNLYLQFVYLKLTDQFLWVFFLLKVALEIHNIIPNCKFYLCDFRLILPNGDTYDSTWWCRTWQSLNLRRDL